MLKVDARPWQKELTFLKRGFPFSFHHFVAGKAVPRGSTAPFGPVLFGGCFVPHAPCHCDGTAMGALSTQGHGDRWVESVVRGKSGRKGLRTGERRPERALGAGWHPGPGNRPRLFRCVSWCAPCRLPSSSGWVSPNCSPKGLP